MPRWRNPPGQDGPAPSRINNSPRKAEPNSHKLRSSWTQPQGQHTEQLAIAGAEPAETGETRSRWRAHT